MEHLRDLELARVWLLIMATAFVIGCGALAWDSRLTGKRIKSDRQADRKRAEAAGSTLEIDEAAARYVVGATRMRRPAGMSATEWLTRMDINEPGSAERLRERARNSLGKGNC